MLQGGLRHVTARRCGMPTKRRVVTSNKRGVSHGRSCRSMVLLGDLVRYGGHNGLLSIRRNPSSLCGRDLRVSCASAESLRRALTDSELRNCNGCRNRCHAVRPRHHGCMPCDYRCFDTNELRLQAPRVRVESRTGTQGAPRASRFRGAVDQHRLARAPIVC
jgi:hypothetical protein